MSSARSSETSVVDVKSAFDGQRIVPGRVALKDGRVLAIGVQPPGERFLAAPGLVDLQVNGFAGVDFLAASVADFTTSSLAPLAFGVTAFQPTLISAPESGLCHALETIARAGQLAGGARILPAHLEGPFLSPSWPGAHDPRYLCAPDHLLLDRFLDAGPVGYMTIAPELPGGIDLLAHLRERGIIVALGHSDATLDQANAAFDAGARALTHAFNAHRPLTAREPGPAGAALVRDDVFVELIVDGIHLDDALITIVDRCARERVILVTDAIVAAGIGDGAFQFGPLEVIVANGRATLSDGRLAGSVATLDACLRRLVAASVPLEQALRAVTSRPAELIGRNDLGHLQPGDRADLVVFDEELFPAQTFLDGRLVWQAKVSSCA
ncbi:MAG: N-acetylglucosamine-6-phosphate deacetylase [Acidimicrobiales bacterium]|jgi:N-acetylglucosamine-6-phosphate deacetylase